jgi:hypothetical protein
MVIFHINCMIGIIERRISPQCEKGFPRVISGEGTEVGERVGVYSENER